MGLLKKLPSFNKKSRNKSTERPPLPSSSTIDPPLSLKLDFEGESERPQHVNGTLNKSITTTTAAASPPPPSSTNAATATNTSLFDDIFSEFNQPSSVAAQGNPPTLLFLKEVEI
jgi:hypothetical protein